ncbi:GDP-mannose 4,6-dehydratase [Chloroflexota bacterium]
MRALITGVGGFAGQHLVRAVQQMSAVEVYGTVFLPVDSHPELAATLAGVKQVDLRDSEAVQDLLAEVRPDYIFHLAAQAFVPRSFEAPWETLDNNIQSQLNLFLSVINLGLPTRFLVVSSSEVYGIVPSDQLPVTETQPFRPLNPYSVSKVTQDMLGLQYHLSHQLPIVRVRPFNHIGPGQNPRFVAPSFATQIARIEAGLQEVVIRVGNLSPRRDFTDVRDVTAAYVAAISKGQAGAVYNVCSGQSHSIQEVLDSLLSMSTAPVEVQVDPARLRVVDNPVVVGSADLLREDTGWQPAITFEQSLYDVLEEARARVAREIN